MKKNLSGAEFTNTDSSSAEKNYSAANISPEQISFLKNLIENFNSSTARLEEAYSTLQGKFNNLNLKLEETNLELKESLTEQERLSDYLTNILESLSSGVLVVDNGGVITLFNAGAEKITGVKTSDALGRPYREIMGAGVPKEYTPLSVFSEKDTRQQFEKNIKRSDGISIPVGCSVSPLLNKNGGIIGAVEIFMDISPIKRLEEELAQKEKLAALGQMAATMAHKIRNPLGGIAGFAGLVEMETSGNEKCTRLTGRIMEGVEKINRIVTSLLAYTSVMTLKPRETEMVSFIGDLLKQMRAEFPSTDFADIPGKDHYVADIDTVRMREVLYSLLLNAAESGASKITVSVCDSFEIEKLGEDTMKIFGDRNEKSKFYGMAAGYSVICIEDNGCGMDEKTMENLFVPFYTTKENGTGLGLASAKKIIEGHHGEIYISGKENSGTKVFLILPAAGQL